ncbi:MULTISPECIES: RING finger domain-containing protein [unclassified Endozoicomonas]|uniref:RING finger domain-containing protein n=1 Tax=unclassified Endozoicomonas TaxID=2644528 RepID=UPI002148DBD7|nr:MULTISPECIES: RING finger domain-containing protein [unclassified Endozoicomonas]
MMVKTLSTVLFLLLLSLSVICQAEKLTRRFVVEFAPHQGTGSLDRVFSIKHNLNTLPVGSLDIDDTNGCPYFSAANEPGGLNGYGLATRFIASIYWQWLYPTHLLVAYELALTTNGAPLGSIPCLRLPEKAFIAVGWLLKSYWNPDSLLFNPMGQPGAAFVSTQVGHPFAIITKGPNGHDEQKNAPPDQPLASSSGQQASARTTQLRASFTSPLDSGSADGNEDPEQHRHTYGLDCYVDACNGVCQFRPPAAIGGLAEANEECPVCLDKLDDVITVPCCSKKIDRHCLQKVILSASRWSCPLCRGDLSSLAQSPDFVAGIKAQQDLPDSYNEASGIRSSQTTYFGEVSETIIEPAGSFTSLLHSSSADGNQLHTLSLYCPAYPCDGGVCRYQVRTVIFSEVSGASEDIGYLDDLD